MEPDRLKEILNKFKDITIGVAGDYSLDAYWIVDTNKKELSVETWKPVNVVASHRYSPGGASNIAANLAALGVGTIKAFGVIGNDLFGREMNNQFDRLDVDCDGIVVQDKNWDTTVFAKPYINNEEQQRYDFGTYNSINAETENKLIENIKKQISKIDVLIINQQISRGYHSDKVISHLNRMAEKYKDCIFIVDSRHKSKMFKNMIFKINALEAAEMCEEEKEVKRAVPVEALKKYAEQIHKKGGKPVYITRGNRGLIMYDGKDLFQVPGIQILKKTDPVGAGDTLTSALAASLSVGASEEEAAEIANLAAGVTVQKLKTTGTATQQEIISIGTNTDYVFNPELAEDIRRARYLEGLQIEIITRRLELGKVKHALFDHDGTISTLRQGWESIMEPVMIKAIMGDHYKKATEEECHEVQQRVNDFIDKSTGIQTILQMQELVEMVKEFGFVPKKKILTAKGYKDIYNKALMELINKRIKQFKDGELDIFDYTVKGAVKFCKELSKRGVKLYLASGTDEQDVKNEAKVLGYAYLFKGNIFGAIGDISKYSKKMVIDRIIEENNLEGPQLICFGDGPVELKETKKRGGIAVGVSSDEVRRFGLNKDKRVRLIKAGADILVPDFSQGDRLLKYIFK